MTRNETIEGLHTITPYAEILPQRAEALGVAIKSLEENPETIEKQKHCIGYTSKRKRILNYKNKN